MNKATNRSIKCLFRMVKLNTVEEGFAHDQLKFLKPINIGRRSSKNKNCMHTFKKHLLLLCPLNFKILNL